ncbi:MAG: response regulator transcription factor [Microbacteriaceae bacterium]|nr:response regulator transcription factor [Microbacteriaceae bacterium]
MDYEKETRRVAVIIEDDPDVRNLLEEILVQAGFDTVTTTNGADGIRAVKDNNPAIITLDVNMPGMDGFETAKRIRRFSPCYLIMVSGRDEEFDTLQGLQSGADDYIAKPFRPRELRARIDALLRRPLREDQPDAALRETSAASTNLGMIEALPTMLPAIVPQRVARHTSTGTLTANGADDAADSTDDSNNPDDLVYPVIEESGPNNRDAFDGHSRDSMRAPSPTPVTVPMSQAMSPATTVRSSDLLTSAPEPLPADWFSHNGLRLSSVRRQVLLNSVELDLTRTEFDLLSALLQSGGRVRSKSDLTLWLHGESYVTTYFVSDADKRAIEAHMGNLRRKLDDDSTNPRWIETVRGVGYRLAAVEAA